MKHISWLNLIGGLIALTMAIVYFVGLAHLIGAAPLYVVMAIGIVLMVWDFIVSTGETTDKRGADGPETGFESAARMGGAGPPHSLPAATVSTTHRALRSRRASSPRRETS